MDYAAPVPEQDYKVLIRCFTYNQEKYIEDALKGFVRQKTNFPFCVIVVDDCSTDRNVEIIKQYERNYPDIIKGFYLPVNMYGNSAKWEYIRPWEKRAQYLAICEGDDYWIDDHKLQKQVDFMDSHPEYMMHFHNAIVHYENHDVPDHVMSNFFTGDFDTALLFKKWQLPLASVLFRKEISESPLLSELNKIFRGGFCFFIVASRMGKVYGLSECLSVYRKNDGGVSNKMSSAYCMDINYGYAVASKDEGAVKVMNKRALRVMSALFISWVFRDKDSIEMKKVIDKYDKMLFFKAILYQPLVILRKILCKIRTIIRKVL